MTSTKRDNIASTRRDNQPSTRRENQTSSRKLIEKEDGETQGE